MLVIRCFSSYFGLCPSLVVNGKENGIKNRKYIISMKTIKSKSFKLNIYTTSRIKKYKKQKALQIYEDAFLMEYNNWA